MKQKKTNRQNKIDQNMGIDQNIGINREMMDTYDLYNLTIHRPFKFWTIALKELIKICE